MIEMHRRKTIYFLVIYLLVVFLSQIIPFNVPLTGVILLLIFIYFISFSRNSYVIPNSPLIATYLLYFFAYLVPILYTDYYYPIIFSDLVNGLQAIIFILLLSFCIKTKEDFAYFKEKFFYGILYLTIFIIPLSLYKFFLALHMKTIAYFMFANGQYPVGTSLVADYNMYALGLFESLIACDFCIRQTKNPYMKFFILFVILLTAICILLCSSRRGLVVLGGLILWYLGKEFKALLSLRKLTMMLIFFFAIVAIVISFEYFFINILNSKGVESLFTRAAGLLMPGQAFEPRTERIDYTFLLISQFSLLKILFGDGYNYLFYFSNHFVGSNVADYPHNPFLSAFLSGGLLNVLALSAFVVVSIISYFKTRIISKEFFLMYVIAWFFGIISSDTFFTIKLIPILSLIPLAVYSLKKSQNEKNLNAVV